MSDQPVKKGDSERAGFLGYVAHEVRNPLSTALWSAELLSRMPAEDRGGARGERLSAMCLRSLSRVRQLVEDHLLCERLDAGGIPLRPEPISLREALQALVARGEHGEVAVDVEPDIVLTVDRALLERVLDSVVAAAAAEKAPVRVSAGPVEGGRVTLWVRGHAPAEGALADPAKGSPSEVRGRALALPVARRIAGTLGGALTASADGYALSLPAPEAHDARSTPAARP